MRRLSAELALILLATLAAERTGRASSAVEFPDNGVAQFSRGGAWLVTASDPIAGYYNPAALATQPTSVGIGFNLVFQKTCFDRHGTNHAPQSYRDGGEPYPEVCNDNAGKPNALPNAAFAYRVNEALGVGLTVTPRSAFGKLVFPDAVTAVNSIGFERPIPAPQRYLSMGVDETVLWPTLSAGYAVTPQLRVGAGFVSGIAILELSSMSMVQVDPAVPFDQPETDARSTLNVKDLFVPGFVLSAHYTATPNIELAAWYRFSDRIKAKGDLEVVAPYYTNAPGNQVRTRCGEPNAVPGQCAETFRSVDQIGEDKNSVTVTVPMEARIGIRWHMPQRPSAPLLAEKLRKDAFFTRDPLRDDLYDVELDLSWANNSAAEEIEIRLTPLQGAATEIPRNADRPTGYKDSFGVRVGGQYTLLRNKLGLRLGTWIESSATDPEFLTVTDVAALRGGFGGGVVFRVQLVDVEAGYQHLWNDGLDNGGNGQQRAIAGTTSGGGSFDNRSYHSVNDGSITQSGNAFSVGAVARF
jgi:long-subunit fatty acid transport protein